MRRLPYNVLAASTVAVFIPFIGYRVFFSPVGPMVQYNAIADLGDREFGEVAVAKLSFANVGDQKLKVNDITSSAGCTCSGLEREINGQFYRVHDFFVPPGAVEHFNLRLAVREPPGASIRHMVSFRTNDPRKSHGDIEVLVPSVRGVSFVPTSIIFGEVGRGGSRQQVVSLTNVGTDGVKIDKVITSHPELLRAEVHAPDRSIKPIHQPGQSICNLDVTLNAQSPGLLDGAITIYLIRGDRSYHVSIPISARVVKPITAYPNKIVLPRTTAEGQSYIMTCMLKSIDNKPFEIDLSKLPQGIRAHVAGERPYSGVQLLTIDGRDLAEKLASETVVQRLRLPATCGTESTTVDMEIEIHSTAK